MTNDLVLIKITLSNVKKRPYNKKNDFDLVYVTSEDLDSIEHLHPRLSKDKTEQEMSLTIEKYQKSLLAKCKVLYFDIL